MSDGYMTTFCESPCLTSSAPTNCGARHCLIRHSTGGDRAATELLFERLYAAAYRQAQRLCHGRDDAQDLAQDTLLLAYQGLAHLKDPHLLIHWMSRIAWNRYFERLRISKFAPPSFDEYTDSQHSGFVAGPDHPIDKLIARETAWTLALAVRALPPTLGRAFQLRVIEQLSTRETAMRLGTTEMAVRTRLRRARLLLRDSLNPKTEPKS